MRDHVALGHPLDALPQGGALAVITLVEGGGYRLPGTMMAVLPSGARVGDLTSGCIEADVVLHAQDAMRDGERRVLRYGEGSPFADLRLPCGGAMEVTVIPHPDRETLARAGDLRRNRKPFTLWLANDVHMEQPSNGFAIHMQPEIRFVTLGTGIEAEVFANTARGAGFDCLHDLTQIDARTAITLFFHDHDREIPLLMEALQTNAFYIGAQGSYRASLARAEALRVAGADPAASARIHGPVGLIPQARDARVLAVSVLAEVLAKAAPFTSSSTPPAN